MLASGFGDLVQRVVGAVMEQDVTIARFEPRQMKIVHMALYETLDAEAHAHGVWRDFSRRDDWPRVIHLRAAVALLVDVRVRLQRVAFRTRRLCGIRRTREADEKAIGLRADIEEQGATALVNLASEEYFKSVRPKLLGVPVITPVFEDYKNGKYKIISFFAKRARGMMARYAALKGVTNPEKLKKFDLDGYAFVKGESSETSWVFRRRVEG